MRRWFTLLFILHLLVSAGLFAPGQNDSRDTGANALHAAATLAVATDEPGQQEGEQLALVSDHNLTESASEVPEWLHLTTTTLMAVAPQVVPASHASPALAPPAIDGPLRPPRPPHVLA